MSSPLAVLVAAQARLTPAEAEACGQDAGAACLLVYRTTHNVGAAWAADWLVAKPFKILLIVGLAVVLNRIVQRGIGRFLKGLETVPVPRGLGTKSEHSAASLLATGPLKSRAKQRAETLGAVLRSITKAAIAVIAGLMVLSEFGVDLGPLIAGAGIVGVAIGFGSQSLVRDFLSGTFMLIEDQFGVGDVIDAGDATGVVEGISLRVTRLRDVEGVVWHIPNGEIRRVGNKSQEWSRALLDIEVAYDTDLRKVQEVIKAVADEVWRDEEWSGCIIEEPEVWGVETFGPSGIVIRMVVKTKPADQWKVMRVLRQRLKAAFDDEGIEMAFPQQSVWVRNADGDGAPAPSHLASSEEEPAPTGKGDAPA